MPDEAINLEELGKFTLGELFWFYCKEKHGSDENPYKSLKPSEAFMKTVVGKAYLDAFCPAGRDWRKPCFKRVIVKNLDSLFLDLDHYAEVRGLTL